MAMDKDEIDKYVFDPNNPRACIYYNLLLSNAKKEAHSLFSTDFFLFFIYTLDIFKKDFEDELEVLDVTEISNATFEEINKDKYIENIKEKYSFLKKITKYAYHENELNWWSPFIYLIKEYLTDIIKKVECPNKLFIQAMEYKKRFIIFSNCMEFAKFNIVGLTVFITLKKNTDEFYANKKTKYYFPIFLEKMEDLEVLLKTVEEDLDKKRKIESHKFGYLGAIKIENYFSIKNMEITNLKNKKEIYFVGENGDGKTILLQAILLALKKEYSGPIIEYIRPIEKDMELSVKDEFAQDYSKDKNISNVFAYGINRNKVREKFDKYGYSGLFDTSDFKETTFLKEPEEILKSDKEDLIDEFIEKFNEIILQDSIKIEKDDREKKFIFKEDKKKIDFDKLSEGYKSTIIWLFDLVSRLIENIEKNDDIIKELKDFKAIVLIDEVDLYLHPKWKYDFVYNLRKVFPNIQFIMVTHSAVTILGASEDAIFYKIYKENGETKISHPIDSIKNFMANTLNTSPLFNMETARARNSDENLDTRENYISAKIHNIIKERVKGKKAIVEEDIEEMINQELDSFLKENDL